MWNWIPKNARRALSPGPLVAAVMALRDGVKNLKRFGDISLGLKLPFVTKLCRSCELWHILRPCELARFFWRDANPQ